MISKLRSTASWWLILSRNYATNRLQHLRCHTFTGINCFHLTDINFSSTSLQLIHASAVNEQENMFTKIERRRGSSGYSRIIAQNLSFAHSLQKSIRSTFLLLLLFLLPDSEDDHGLSRDYTPKCGGNHWLRTRLNDTENLGVILQDTWKVKKHSSKRKRIGWLIGKPIKK